MSECNRYFANGDQNEVLTHAEVLKIVKLSRPHVWALRNRGEFPLPLDYPTTGNGKRRRLYWLRRDIEAWLAARSRKAITPTSVPFAELHHLGARLPIVSEPTGDAV